MTSLIHFQKVRYFRIPIYFVFCVKLLLEGSDKMEQCASNSWNFVVFNYLDLNSQADASGFTANTLNRTFSLLESAAQEESSVGSAIPIHQIISLVSMTSPRTFRPHKVSTSPAFVEFNTSESGYG